MSQVLTLWEIRIFESNFWLGMKTKVFIQIWKKKTLDLGPSLCKKGSQGLKLKFQFRNPGCQFS